MLNTQLPEVQEENETDPVETVLFTARQTAGDLGKWGIELPGVTTLGPCGPVTVIDDRDLIAARPRTHRFDAVDLGRALLAAASVSIIPYEKRGGRRIGVRAADWQALTLATRIGEGGAVVVLTSSDRVRYWLEEIRARCRLDVVAELFDRHGVAKMVEGGV